MGFITRARSSFMAIVEVVHVLKDRQGQYYLRSCKAVKLI